MLIDLRQIRSADISPPFLGLKIELKKKQYHRFVNVHMIVFPIYMYILLFFLVICLILLLP